MFLHTLVKNELRSPNSMGYKDGITSSLRVGGIGSLPNHALVMHVDQRR